MTRVASFFSWGFVVYLFVFVFTLDAREVGLDPKENKVDLYSDLLPGEKIDFHTGEVKHYLEMVSFEGNGLPIRLGHKVGYGSSVEGGYGIQTMSGVTLDIPELEISTVGDSWSGIGQYMIGSHGGCSDYIIASDAIIDQEGSTGYYREQTSPLSILTSSIKLKKGLDTIHFFPKSHEPSPTRFPSSAVFISPSNWYITCTNTPLSYRVVSPKGLSYTFTKLMSGYEGRYKGFHLASIEDIHGNALTYNYGTFVRPEFDAHLSGSGGGDVDVTHVRLESIVATDGRELTIEYSYDPTSGTYNPQTSNSTYAQRHRKITIRSNSAQKPIYLKYSYHHSSRSVSVEREDGKTLKYSLGIESSGEGIEEVKYFNGLKVAYEYEKGIGGYVRAGGGSDYDKFFLEQRTITTPDTDGNERVHVENFDYHHTSSNVNDDESINTTFVESPTKSVSYTYKKINFLKEWDDTPVDSGQLLFKKLFPSGTSFSQRNTATPLKETTYTYSKQADVIDFNHLESTKKNVYYAHAPHHSYRTVVSEKVTSMNGFDFVINKNNYNKWGYPRRITELNNLVGVREIERTYHNDSSNWIIGKLKRESIAGELAKSDFVYNTKGSLISKTINGIHEFYAYHSDGNLREIAQYKNGSVVPIKTLTDYKRGIARNITDGVGNTKRTEVFDFGEVQSEADFNGNTIFYKYDSLRRLEQINYPDRIVSVISWPTELKKITTQGGYKETVNYNAMMQPTLVIEEDVNRAGSRIYSKITYDVSGRKKLVSFPSSHDSDSVGREYSYDALGRPTEIKNTGDNSKIEYCYGSTCGNGVAHGVLITNPRGYKTVKNYRSFGNPDVKDLMLIKEQKTGGSYITTTLSRNIHGQVTNINQGSQNQTFHYNSGTLLLDRKFTAGEGTIRFGYDSRGNTTSRSSDNAGTATNYSYDNNDRVTSINYPGTTKDVSYEYDRVSLFKITTGTGTERIALEYDWTNGNQIKREKLSLDGMNFVTTYVYDVLGNISTVRLPSIEYPSSAIVMDITTDALGRTREIDGFVSDVSYYPNGVLSSMLYGNDQEFTGFLNTKRLPSTIFTKKGGGTIVDLTYDYDHDNNVSSITDSINFANNRSMTYDGLNRMIMVNGRWGSGSVSYTDNHDISSLILGSSNLSYNYSSGLLTSVIGSTNKSFNYDSYGNVTSNGTDSFIYDDANQMVRVSSKNITYRYDGNKKRVKVKTPTKTVYYFYNLAGELLYRYDKTNNKDIGYINLNGKLIAKLEQTAGGTPPPSPGTIKVQSYWSPSTVHAGDTATYYWSSTNATSCTSANGTVRPPSGSVTLVRNTVVSGGIARITCKNNSVTSNVSHAVLTVLPVGTPINMPVVTSSWSPSTITAGQTSTYSWSATNATGCLSANGTVRTSSGSVTLVRNTVGIGSASISCTGSGGTAPPSYASLTVLDPGSILAPSLISPLGIVSPSPVSFSWTAVSNTTSYSIKINGVSNTISAASVGCSGGSGTCVYTTGMSFTGSNNWQVSAIGSGLWSSLGSFSVTTGGGGGLTIPTQISPNGLTTTKTPTYRWYAVSGASSYTLRLTRPNGSIINPSPVSASAAGCGSGTGICSYTPGIVLEGVLSLGGGDSWQVKSNNGGASSGFSSTMGYYIEVPSVPLAPTLVSPTGSVSTSPADFTWNAVNTATSYTVEINGVSNSVPAASMGCSGGSGVCTYTAGTVFSGINNWRVSAINSAGTGLWSSLVTFTVSAISGGTPEITSPVPGSTLSGSTQTFNWVSNGDPSVNRYWLEIGTSLGGTEIFGDDLGLSTSQVVTGLPTDGSTIYVQLYYNDTNWDSIQYTYVASNSGGGSTTPEITSPTPGSTLSGSTQTFTWTSNGDPSVNAYWLEVGTTLGGYDIFNDDLGLSTSQVVTGLPTDGSIVYVRLYYNDTNWDTVEYTYTASSGGGTGGVPSVPTLISPSGNITDAMPTFTWNAVTGSTLYTIRVYDGSGASYMFASNTPSEANCSSGSGICSYTSTNGWNVVFNEGETFTWKVNASNSSGESDFSPLKSFNVIDLSGGTTPEITSPTPGSTLSGSTQTFNWISNGDPSVNRYWLEIGTTLGGTEIFGDDLGLSTSQVVTGLPTDGSTIYVQLYYNDTNWDSIQYTYTGGN